MFGKEQFTDWRPPLATSPRWQTRQISLGFSVPDPSHYRQALASALQCHCFPPVFDVVSGPERWRYDCGTVHIADDVDAEMTARIVLAISKEESPLSPTVDLAVRIGAPILLTVFRQSDQQDVIKIAFDIGLLSASQASWFLLHIAQAIPTPKGSRPTSRASFVLHKVEDLLFRSGEPLSTRRYEVPHNHIFPPIGELASACFYERVKAIPLAPAILCFDPQHLSGAEPVISLSYLELYLCALSFIRRLELGGIRHGDSVALGRLHPHLATVVTVALSMSGIASIPAEALNNIAHSDSYHCIPSAIITEDPFPGVGLPTIDPPDLNDSDLYTEDTAWPQLPSISKEEPFLLDVTSGTFISNTSFLDTLLMNYDSMSLCQKRILYADVRVNSRMLEIIWQTLLHGGSICSLFGDIQGKSIGYLAQTLPQTHFCIEEKALRGFMANITTECVTLPTIMLPCEPTPATKDLLLRNGLSYVALEKLLANRSHSNTMTSVIKEPIRILLQCKNSDLTPDEVLRNLETGVNLNKFDTGTSVRLIFGDKVVKYGGLVRAAEAYNMEYVRTRTRINIPPVHLAFYYAGRTYIVADYVRGHTLQELWTSANKNQRLTWASQLGEIMSQLRALPSMHSTRRGPLNPSTEERCEGRWFTSFGAGPFHSHHDLATWLNRKLSVARRGGGNEGPTYPVFESTGRLVVTHQDLAARNLILDVDGRLWVIDWELAGWYPEYIEYACIASDTGSPQSPVPQGWTETVLSFIQPYKREYDMLQSLRWVLDVMPFS